jgi:hypothetical protein
MNTQTPFRITEVDRAELEAWGDVAKSQGWDEIMFDVRQELHVREGQNRP